MGGEGLDRLSGLCTVAPSRQPGAGLLRVTAVLRAGSCWSSSVHSASLWIELGAGLLVGGGNEKIVIWENLSL